MFDDKEYSEHEFDQRLREGNQYLEKMQFQEAETALRAAREIAFALALSARLTPLDRLIRRARDQQQWYEEIRAGASRFGQLNEAATRLEALQHLGDIIGQTAAMDYHLLIRQARSIRHEVIVSLEHIAAAELAQQAMDRQDYELVAELLGGLHDEVQADSLQHAQRLYEASIAPKLQQAIQLRTQGQPLDGLGPLRDLRHDFPASPAWRMPWFAAARAQGEYLLEQGRRQLSDAEYEGARSLFRNAQLAFEQGAEAYPDASSTLMLLTEARDLRELAADLGQAYAAQQAQAAGEALQQFEAIAAKLQVWAEAGRDYSLPKFEVALYLKRLGKSVAHSDSSRKQLNAVKQALAQGQFDQAAVLLAEIEPGEIASQSDIAAEMKQLQTTLEQQRQRRQQVIREVEQLADRDPIVAGERWLEAIHEQSIGPAPTSLIEQVTLMILSSCQQHDWNLADKGLVLARRLGVTDNQLSDLEGRIATARHFEQEALPRAEPDKKLESDARQAISPAEPCTDKPPGEVRRLLRQIKCLIETGKYDAARDALRTAEEAGLPEQQIEAFEQVAQAGQRLTHGRELLEQGEFELAVARLQSAAALSRDQAGADLIHADAQLWLKRALEKLGQTVEATTPALVDAPAVDSRNDPARHLIAWALHIEPKLAQARNAYLTGDRAQTLNVLTELLGWLSNASVSS